MAMNTSQNMHALFRIDQRLGGSRFVLKHKKVPTVDEKQSLRCTAESRLFALKNWSLRTPQNVIPPW